MDIKYTDTLGYKDTFYDVKEILFSKNSIGIATIIDKNNNKLAEIKIDSIIKISK